MNDDAKILIPYDRREAISLRVAAEIADRSESTVRTWCLTRSIGRRVCGGPWQVSRVALQMLLEEDGEALKLYLRGERRDPKVSAYFKRLVATKKQELKPE